MGLNNNRKKDNFDDIVVSVKSAAEAEKREVFLNRATDKLSYKKQDRSIVQIENEPVALPAYESVLLSLAQTGTDAPTAVVLNNDTEITPTLTRNALELSPGDLPGNYRIVMPGAFAGKLVRLILPVDSYGSGPIVNTYAGGKASDDEIYFYSSEIDTATGEITPADDALFDGYSFLEIQIWDIPA